MYTFNEYLPKNCPECFLKYFPQEEEKPSGVIQNVLGRFLGRRQKQSVPERIIQEETEEIPEEKPAVTVSATGNVRRRL